jgi:hypothetical protein
MTKTFPGSGCKTSTGGKSISCKTSDKKSKLQLSQIFGTTNLYKARFKLKGVGLMDTTLQQPFTVTLTTGFTSRAGSLGSPHCVFGANGSVSCRP